MIFLIIYGIASIIVVISTVTNWLFFEKEIESLPTGDEHLIHFSKYTWANFLFFPSLIICEVYLIVVRILNVIINY